MRHAVDAEAHQHVGTSRGRTAVQGVFWSLFSSVTPGLVSAGVFLATSRTLRPDDFGVVALASTVVALLSAVAPAGFGQAIVQRAVLTRAHLDSVFWLCAGVGAVLYAAVFGLARPIAHATGQPLLALLMPVLGIKIVLDLFAVVPNAILTRTMAFNKLAMRTVVASVAGAAACLLVLFAGYGLWALALSQLVSSAAIFLGSLISAGWLPQLSFERSAMRELSRFGGFASGANFINSINIDQLMIGTLLGPFALGLFGFSRRIFQLMSDVMAGPLNAVSFSLLSSMQHEEEKRRRAFLLATFISALVSFPVFVGFALIAKDAIPTLFGAHWLEAVPVVQAFCAIGVLASIGVLQSSLINSNGNAELWLLYILAKQIGAAFYIWLFYRYGVAELSASLAILTYLMWLPSVYIVARILRMRMRDYLASFAVPLTATLALIAALSLLRLYWQPSGPLPRLAGAIALGATVYCSVAWLLAHRQLQAIWRIISNRRRAA